MTKHTNGNMKYWVHHKTSELWAEKRLLSSFPTRANVETFSSYCISKFWFGSLPPPHPNACNRARFCWRAASRSPLPASQFASGPTAARPPFVSRGPQWGGRPTEPPPDRPPSSSGALAPTHARPRTRMGRRGGGVGWCWKTGGPAARPLFPLRACPVPFGRRGKEVPSQPLQAAGAIFKCLCQALVRGSRCRSPGAPGDAEVALRRGRANCRLTDTRTEVEEALQCLRLTTKPIETATHHTPPRCGVPPFKGQLRAE